MSSKREEERNEKIIRGLMKLPPNRRCINCNSLGPQYVCTNFWTFVCTTCSGIHREFTHRVKSVSMAKFTYQEVDALQKVGNQRARELYLNSWDLQRERLPNNSDVDKVREFIKNVYVDKKYTLEKSSSKPPRDPQSLTSPENETRRASSYHSYSQSPPYDFQYEERKYGKHAPVLTRKPGSDRGLYEGKSSSFLSPVHSSDDKFSNEGSYSRASDFSVSAGNDMVLSVSPSSHIEAGSLFSETSLDFSKEVSFNSDANSIINGGGNLHQQRSSSGSFGSVDSNSLSFTSVNSVSLPESEQPQHISHVESSSFLSVAFGGLDLFELAPKSVSSIPSNGSNSQLRNFQSSPLDLFTELSQPQPASPFSEQASVAIMPNDGGWATFDVPQNAAPAAVPLSNGNALGSFNPFSIDQSSTDQDHKPSVSEHTFVLESIQDVDTTISDNNFWNAFDDAAPVLPSQKVVKNSEEVDLHSVSEAENFMPFGGFEALGIDGNLRASDGYEQPSSLSSHFSEQLNDFSIISEVDVVQSFATDHRPSNPFDLAPLTFDSDMEPTNTSQFWEMGSLQAALPNNQTSASYVGGINESWFPQNPISPFVPGGVPFDPSTGSLGLLAGQPPSTPTPNVHAEGPLASVGGNPFS